MPRAPPPGFYVLSAIALFVWFILYTSSHQSKASLSDRLSNTNTPIILADPLLNDTIHGAATAPKLSNETAKAELGRAAWKLLHTTMARFPDTPTADESRALRDYIYLFARLYPCGECARHFQGILARYPPQTAGRASAAAWACFVHNEVNVSKGKPVFDCAEIGDWYDCGCAEDEKGEMSEKGKSGGAVQGAVDGKEEVVIEREGLMNGG